MTQGVKTLPASEAGEMQVPPKQSQVPGTHHQNQGYRDEQKENRDNHRLANSRKALQRKGVFELFELRPTLDQGIVESYLTYDPTIQDGHRIYLET